MTENKPQPLDLRDIEKKIEELAFEVDQVIDWKVEPKGEWDEDTIKNIVRRDVKIFSHVDYAVELRDIEELFQEIKQRIKSACEFFLRYINSPDLLMKEHPKFKKEIEDRFGRWVWDDNSQEVVFEWKEDIFDFNEWLFKLAFKDVLRGDENERK